MSDTQSVWPKIKRVCKIDHHAVLPLNHEQCIPCVTKNKIKYYYKCSWNTIIISLTDWWMAAGCLTLTLIAQLKDHVSKLSDRPLHFQHSASRLAMDQVCFHTLTVWHSGACQAGVKKLATLYWNCRSVCDEWQILPLSSCLPAATGVPLVWPAAWFLWACCLAWTLIIYYLL